MANNYICVDLGDYYVRMADASFNQGKFTLDHIGSTNRIFQLLGTENEKIISEETKIIENFLGQTGSKKKTINLIIPDSYTYSQIMEMPELKEKELLSAIKYQSDQFIPLPLAETSLDIDVIYQDKTNKKLLILIVAASNVLITKLEDAIERMGYIPDVIENEVSVFSRLLGSGKNLNENIVFVNFNYMTTSLYFYDSRLNLITDIHNFKLGLELFIREAQINFNISREKAIEALKNVGFATTGPINMLETLRPALSGFINEIDKFIVNIKDKHKVESISKIVLYNLADEVNLIDQALSKPLGIPAGKFNLSTYVNANTKLESYKNSLTAFVNVIAGNLR